MTLECPYCEKEIGDPDSCYEQGVSYEHECPYCEKMFVFEVEYTRYYNANKADCLNGGAHRYKEHQRFGIGEPEVFQRCQDCGYEELNKAVDG